MIDWDAAHVAAASGAALIQGAEASAGGREAGLGLRGPRRVTIDSRQVQPGDLFVGLPGQHVDGGAYAAQALAAGAWGVLVAPEHAPVEPEGAGESGTTRGAVLAHPDPLAALQALAHAWRRALGAKVIAVTGSTGKTSTKDILAALLACDRAGASSPQADRSGVSSLRADRAQASDPQGWVAQRIVASPQNLNTEIGLPLAVLGAPRGTAVLVLELAMRGPGQIAELAAIAEPDVGVIVNVGPVHLELLGSLEAIAAAKAELIAGLAPGATIVIPAHEPLLAPHLRADLRTVTFGEGGDVELVERRPDGEVTIVEHRGAADPCLITLRPSFAQSHNLRNLLAAVAAARALGVTPAGKLDVAFSALRGERIALTDGIVLINDCYNANPMSMRAALDDLAETAPARRVAVLGDMLELGPDEQRLHQELAAYAAARGVELLIAVGPLAAGMGEGFLATSGAQSAGAGSDAGASLEAGATFHGVPGAEFHSVPDAGAAAELLPGLLRPEDTVLVKGSRGVGLERVAQALVGAR